MTGEERCELWERKRQAALKDWIARFRKALASEKNEDHRDDLVAAIQVAESF